MWPLNFQNFGEGQLAKLSLPEDQLKKYQIDGRDLWIMDDTRNPTLSYKDRASVVALKAKQMGIKEISAASTGNAGSSLAGICSKLGLNPQFLSPKIFQIARKFRFNHTVLIFI